MFQFQIFEANIHFDSLYVRTELKIITHRSVPASMLDSLTSAVAPTCAARYELKGKFTVDEEVEAAWDGPAESERLRERPLF